MRSIETIRVDAIDVVERGRRAFSAAEVAKLSASIAQIGLQTPITVKYYPSRPSSDGTDDSYVLIAGAHRLAAVRSLGWEKVDCFVVDCDEMQARLWEIAENLHRADLSKLERDEQIAEWIKITERHASQLATHQKAGQQPGGVNAASRELGIDRDDAHRAVKVASLSEEAKEAAREVGLDDNRSALLEAASKPTVAEQVAAIHQRHTQRAKALSLADDPLNKQVAALMAAWNKAGAPAREEFLLRIDRPVMDGMFA